MRRRSPCWPGAAIAILLAQPAAAQAQDSPRWQIELVGGIGAAAGGRRGDVTLPPPGPAIVTNGPLSPSRAVPSWLFGDGADILNGASAALGVVSRLAPLQDAIADGAPSGRGILAGIRLLRPMTSRWSLEGSVVFGLADAAFDDATQDAADLTRAGFDAVWTELLQTGPFADVVVSATRAAVSGRTRTVTLTGALVLDLPAAGAFVPYAVAGGGVVTGAGSATLEIDGRYAFTVAIPGVPSLAIDERDQVTLRLTTRTTAVGVAGGGFRRRLSDRWTLRADARVHIGRSATRVVLDATPTRSSPGPAGSIETGTNPSIQFSSDPAIGRQSTLSGDPVRDFTLFAGEGVQTRVQITVGVAMRF